jgi:pyrroline-5-carboxylate reductase
MREIISDQRLMKSIKAGEMDIREGRYTIVKSIGNISRNVNRLGFIGTGNMGQALLAGIIKAKLFPARQIIVFDQAAATARIVQKEFKVTLAQGNRQVVTEADAILLCVKPQMILEVLAGIKPAVTAKKPFISIVAGIRTAKIEAVLGKVPVVRVMPNTPALIGQGMSAICAGKWATRQHLAQTERLFAVVGKTIVAPEKLMDAVTGLSGSGPAYVFTFAEGLIEAGQAVGLDAEQARTLSLQTLVGAAGLLAASDKTPAELRAQVTSPNGTTLAGLKAMNVERFKSILVKTVQAATKRSKELGR